MGISKLTVGAVLTALILGLIFFYRNSADQPQPEILQLPGEHLLEQFELVEDMGGGQQWILASSAASRQAHRVELKHPRITYSESGETAVLVTANRGLYDLTDRRLELLGEIVLKRERPRQILRTEQLFWEAQTGILKTEQELTLELPEGILKARGMWADLEEERLKLKSDVEFLGR